MRQRYHAIFKRRRDGCFVGWIEEVPGTITFGQTLRQCQDNLRQSLQLMVETHRDEARLGLDADCITRSISIDLAEQPQPAIA
jgi:predicted RNase H-like HicB family nuclease